MAAGETVVVVHGLWMHGALFAWMARRIAQAGYVTHTYSYPSVRLNLAQNARRLEAFCHALNARRLHLVGHSLGGLLIARMLEEPHRLAVGRVVLLGSPFVDIHAARRLGRVRIGGAAMGATVAEWLASVRPHKFTRHEVGVIAGNRGVGLGRLVAPDLPQPHDGTISVAETHVPHERDHIVLPVTHSQMVMSPLVVRQIGEFLRHGHFAHGEAAAAKQRDGAAA
jgi:pimeloyl-ACP methyl ester carboxylesterase